MQVGDMVMVTGKEAGRTPRSDCAALEPNTKGFELVQLQRETLKILHQGQHDQLWSSLG